MKYDYNEQFRGKEIAFKIHQLKTELNKLEQECKEADPSFSISHMYNYVVIGGKLIIATTNRCESFELERRIKGIAQQVLS